MYGKEYIGKIDIKDLEPEGYEVSFEFHLYSPLFISATLPDDQFLKFIRQELRNKAFITADYFKTVRNTTLDHPLNAFTINGK